MATPKKKQQSINNVLEHIAPKVRKALKKWENDRGAFANGLTAKRVSKLDHTKDQLGVAIRRFQGVLSQKKVNLATVLRKAKLKTVQRLHPGAYLSFNPGCPVFVFRGKPTSIITIKYELDYTFFDEFLPINTTEYLIGYDVETFDILDDKKNLKDRKLLSHQWYFSFKKRRFGVIIVTSRAVTEIAFITFIRNVLRGLIPDNGHMLKAVYAAAHFSLIEYGFMKSTFTDKERQTSSGKTIKYKATTIQSRRKQWTGKIALMDRIPDPKAKQPRQPRYIMRAGRRTIVPPPKVWLHFVDSLNLQPGSLDNLGKTIKITKIKQPYIKEMEKFLEKDPDGFYRYGIRDSIITAEAFAHYARKFGDALNLGFQKRITAYSERYFRDFFKKTFSTDKLKTDWKARFGWVRDLDRRWIVAPRMLTFIPFYYGGRNEVFCVGPRGQAIYHDLKSAYPSSMLMLPDHDFSVVTQTRGTDAVKKGLRRLYKRGPFQVAGVICHFRFKESAKPIFPVRVPEGLIFPQTGYGPVMWPELWAALKHRLLEHCHVDTIIEFKPENTTKIADETYRLLNLRRGEMKPVFKDLLNFYYGKSSQGIREAINKIKKNQDVSRVPTSTITCFPLAAYMTSVCRAVVGELLNMGNECYGITTDGFISPKDTLIPGPLCDMIQKRLAPLNTLAQPHEFDFIQTEFSADNSLFLKTRGYILMDESNKPVNKGKFVKMAQMGVQVDRGDDGEQIAQFLAALVKKEYVKLSWPSIPQMTFDEVPDSISVDDEITKREIDAIRAYIKAKNFIPMQSSSISQVNTTFDMKRIPLSPTPVNFAFRDLTFWHVSFETNVLYSAEDFTLFRIESKPNMGYLEYKKFVGEEVDCFVGPIPDKSAPVDRVLVGEGRLVTNEDNTERNFVGTMHTVPLLDVITEINYDRRRANEPTFFVYKVIAGQKIKTGAIFGWGRTRGALEQFKIIWNFGQPGQATLRVAAGSVLKEEDYATKLGFTYEESIRSMFEDDKYYVFGLASFLFPSRSKRTVM